MLIIQHIWMRWTKQSRGANARGRLTTAIFTVARFSMAPSHRPRTATSEGAGATSWGERLQGMFLTGRH